MFHCSLLLLAPKEWRNTSTCLALLAYNEKGLSKLLEMFENYRDKLSDDMIRDNFNQILLKLKKNSKPEIKPLIEEFEDKLNNYTEEKVDERRKQPAQPVNKRGRGN